MLGVLPRDSAGRTQGQGRDSPCPLSPRLLSTEISIGWRAVRARGWAQLWGIWSQERTGDKTCQVGEMLGPGVPLGCGLFSQLALRPTLVTGERHETGNTKVQTQLGAPFSEQPRQPLPGGPGHGLFRAPFTRCPSPGDAKLN